MPPPDSAADRPARPVTRRPARKSADSSARPRRPGPVPAAGRAADQPATRDLIFAAAATAFARHGFDGAGVDDIARHSGVNKAMLYYHFRSKVGLYRAVVGDMLRAVGAAVSAIAAGHDTPERKVEHFVATVATMRDERPWFPPIMMREMAAGAPHLDAETLAEIRTVLAAFAAILDAGVTAGAFRVVHPLMAYMSIMGPLMINAIRERAAAEPGRAHLPLFVEVERDALVAHVQQTALRMLAKDPAR